jgi:hypothetical protein
LAALILIGFVTVAIIPEHRISRGLARLDRALAQLPARWRSFTLNNLQRFLDSLTVLRRRDTVAGAAGWTAATWGLGIVINYAVQRTFGFDSLLAALPPSIAALGVIESLQRASGNRPRHRSDLAFGRLYTLDHHDGYRVASFNQKT